MHSSKSVAPFGSRFRHWAGRAALLIACVGSMATSDYDSTPPPRPDGPPPASPTIASFVGSPFEFTDQQGGVTRRVLVSIPPQEAALSGDIVVEAEIRAQWHPATPPPRGTSALQLSLTREDGDGHSVPATIDYPEYDPPLNALTKRVNLSHFIDCAAQQPCSWEAELELLLDGDAQGVVRIHEWTLRARIEPSVIEAPLQGSISIIGVEAP